MLTYITVHDCLCMAWDDSSVRICSVSYRSAMIKLRCEWTCLRWQRERPTHTPLLTLLSSSPSLSLWTERRSLRSASFSSLLFSCGIFRCASARNISHTDMVHSIQVTCFIHYVCMEETGRESFCPNLLSSLPEGSVLAVAFALPFLPSAVSTPWQPTLVKPYHGN